MNRSGTTLHTLPPDCPGHHCLETRGMENKNKRLKSIPERRGDGIEWQGRGSLVTLVASRIEFSLWKVGLVGTMTWTSVWDVEGRRDLVLRVCRNAFNVTLAPALIRYFVTPLVEHNMNQIVSLHQSERHACRISSCVSQLKTLPGRRLQSAAEVSVPGWLVLSSGHFLH